MPPVPPAGAFDVRFTGDWKYCGSEGVIEVMNPGEPLEVEFNVRDGEKWELVNKESDTSFILHGKGNIANPGEGDSFILQKIDGTIISDSFILHSAYPNPFNPVTTLRYDLPEESQVTLIIYDLMGGEISTLVNTTQKGGYKSVIWNGTDTFGKPVSAGVYLYQIQAGNFVQVKKMLMLK